MFNEDKLREDIIKTWGDSGAHIEVYDKILKAGKAHFNAQISFPVTVKTVDKDGNPLESVIVGEGTSILYNKGVYFICAHNKEVAIPNEEFERLWPVIRFHQMVGKTGAWFKLRDRTHIKTK